MKYGLIGEKLGHSFSAEIHAHLGDYEYNLTEIPCEALDAFMTERDFLGINVTIPYKERVIPHLDYIDEAAKKIGAVNTVVNRGGRLYGYNTDFYGMSALIKHAGVTLAGRKVAILGTGGTSKTARSVAESQGAAKIITVSRRGGESVSYEALYSEHSDCEVIINTTPVGMFPSAFDKPVDPSRFPILTGVIDAVYNPVRTPLVRSAKALGIPAEGGLYMLVGQAVRASEIFLDMKYEDGRIDDIYTLLCRKKENIVLTGMPASGKSTVGAIIAKKLGRELIDTDAMVVSSTGMEIAEIFKKRGEAEFRRLETEAIRTASLKSSVVIATGGGAVLKKENIDALSANGRIYFIDRPPEALIPTDTRPLSSTREAIFQRYKERYPIYLSTADVQISADIPPECVAEKIIGDHIK